jgi:tetratricopeptide (TPR) repeat protein
MTALSAEAPASPRRRLLLAGAGVVALAAVVVAVVVAASGGDEKATKGARDEMGRALTAGSLASLTRARDLGKKLVEAAPADGDALAALAFVDALLSREYGVPVRGDAEEAVGRARAASGGGKVRTAMLEATASLLALGAGDLAAAQGSAERAVAAAPDQGPRAPRLGARQGAPRRRRRRPPRPRAPPRAHARLRRRGHRLGRRAPRQGRRHERRASAARPGGAHARSRRALLLLSEAQRALADKPKGEPLAAACEAQAKQSPVVRAGCALSAASDARLAGDRPAAIKSARLAAEEAPDDARLLAGAALNLAVLGEVDIAADTLARAKRLARDTAAPVAWADLAVRLGRRQTVSPSALLETAAGPERRLVAARVVLMQGGPSALNRSLRGAPSAVVAFDPDLRALAFLSRDGQGAARRAQRHRAPRRARRPCGELRPRPHRRARRRDHPGPAPPGEGPHRPWRRLRRRDALPGLDEGGRRGRPAATRAARAAIAQRGVPRDQPVTLVPAFS